MNRTLPRLLALAVMSYALTGCADTQYRAFDAHSGDSAEAVTTRVVNYELSETFFSAPPTCVLVLPVRDAVDRAAALLIEQSATRFLRERFARVIGPHQRQSDERRLALLTGTDEGRQTYLADQRCDSYLTLRLEQSEAVYALFWSGRQIGLSASLTRAGNAHLL